MWNMSLHNIMLGGSAKTVIKFRVS